MREPIVLSAKVKKDIKGVIALMQANLDKIDMDSWVNIIIPQNADEEHPCGTTGCLAGYICMYHGYSPEFLAGITKVPASKFASPEGATEPSELLCISRNTDYVEVGDLARALLGLKNTVRWNFLFFQSQWPEPFYSEMESLRSLDLQNRFRQANRKKQGRLVIKRLRYFLKTGL